ncbi:hypothetical protein Tco_1162385 [Tanacetum coccineum]
MASEDVVGKTSATIANLAEEANKIATEGVAVKAPSRHALLTIAKSLVAGGVAGKFRHKLFTYEMLKHENV